MQVLVLEGSKSDNLRRDVLKNLLDLKWTAKETKFERHELRALQPKQFCLLSHALAVGCNFFMFVGRVNGYFADVTRLILLFRVGASDFAAGFSILANGDRCLSLCPVSSPKHNLHNNAQPITR